MDLIARVLNPLGFYLLAGSITATTAAILEVTHDWLQHLENGCEIGAIFFNLWKAFDSVPHGPLITELEGIGLNQYVIQWIRNISLLGLF